MRYQLPNGRIVGPDAEITITSNVRVPAREEGQVDTFEQQDMSCARGWLSSASEAELQQAGITVLEDEAPLVWDERYEQNLGGVISALPAEVMKPKLAQHAAAKRYSKEVGGITVSGNAIRTDRESQAMISGAFAMVQDAPATTIKFKTAGGFVTLNATAVTAIARAVAQHIQNCFAIEADVAAAIEAGEITTFEAVDEQFA